MLTITKLSKECNLLEDNAKVTVEITVSRKDGYSGFDVFPDELIPDLLLAVSRKYSIKKGKLHEKDTFKTGRQDREA